METKEIWVSKAAVSLGNQESIENFSRRVSDAASNKYGTPGTPDKPGTYIWSRAIYPDKIVFEKSVSGMPLKIYSVACKATADSVEFTGEPIEVREVRSYEPIKAEAKGIAIKRNDAGQLWKGLNL